MPAKEPPWTRSLSRSTKSAGTWRPGSDVSDEPFGCSFWLCVLRMKALVKERGFQKLDGNWVFGLTDGESGAQRSDPQSSRPRSKAGQQGKFLDIGRDTSITVAGSAQELSEVIGSIEPDERLSDDLYERYEGSGRTMFSLTSGPSTPV